MKGIPKISESEWQVMKVLWVENPLTANQAIERLSPECKWSPRTIKTLLNRLVKKKTVGFDKKSREYLYYPLVKQDECIRAESFSFLRRVYGGTMIPMLAAFVESEELSEEDIKALKEILRKRGRK